MKTALTIAGSDCSGGSGVQADLKTMTMNGVFGMSVITALTAQNTTGISDVSNVSRQFLAEQLDQVLSDTHPDAVKIGMVTSKDHIDVIAQKLQEYDAENIVMDLVLISTSGRPLISEEALDTLTAELLQLANVVTPNIPEAEVLTDMDINSDEDMEVAARKLYNMYGCAVVLKSGHHLPENKDLLYNGGDMIWFRGLHGPKREGKKTPHGTGCTFSSAIASNLAKGYPLEEAVRRARDYVEEALDAEFHPGQGVAVMDHAFDLAGRYAESPEEDDAEPASESAPSGPTE